MTDDTLITSDISLSNDDRETFQIFVGKVIPASDKYKVPGADDPRIFAEILTASQSSASTITDGLNIINASAEKRYRESFNALTQEQQIGLLDDLQNATVPAIRTIVSIATQCYYRDDRVMESLGMEIRSPFPGGFEVEQGDWSLLDAVKEKDKLYRDV
tara:strand:- start:2359 stop:2835 length:477 start_codon:yes stop_codon:yes gene_type:complete